MYLDCFRESGDNEENLRILPIPLMQKNTFQKIFIIEFITNITVFD